MKTIKQWLSELPKELREEIMEARKKSPFKVLLSTEMYSLSKVIRCSFRWSVSKSGGEFWLSFRDAIKWAESNGEVF